MWFCFLFRAARNENIPLEVQQPDENIVNTRRIRFESDTTTTLSPRDNHTTPPQNVDYSRYTFYLTYFISRILIISPLFLLIPGQCCPKDAEALSALNLLSNRLATPRSATQATAFSWPTIMCPTTSQIRASAAVITLRMEDPIPKRRWCSPTSQPAS